jgi:hypothetical protein
MANEIPIRLSHLLGHSGVGAIVRGSSELVVIQDTRFWTDRQGVPVGKMIPNVERIRAALGIDPQLREPPIARKLTNDHIDGTCIPATQFQSWAHCPGCGALYRRPWRHGADDDVPHCEQKDCKSHPKLEQVIWVLAHPEGYLDDVPWDYLAHKNTRDPSRSSCKVRDQLQLIERDYDERTIHCRACGAKAEFRGDERVGFGHGRMQPWTKDDLVPPAEGHAQSEQDLPQVLTINDTRVYAPVAESVLVIPPESRVRKDTAVDRLYRNSSDRARIDTASNLLARNGAIKTLAREYRCTPADIEAALTDLANGYPLYGENFTLGQLRESEFAAFLETLPDQRDDEDFVTHNKNKEWRELGQSDDLDTDVRHIVYGVSHLIRVERLKAVKVFKGFTRLGGKVVVPPDIVGKADCLPAIALYGEGIFIALDEARLSTWEQHPAVSQRLQRLLPRFVHAGRDTPKPLSARFMLLHTLSHLLIRQIEFEGGYPAAALTERLYCAKAPTAMAGILIHVAVPDIAGSLGGLIELAEPRRFLGILTRALEHGYWCSLDPVCSEHEGQGPGLLNRAACHACALVPQQACEFDIALLDRGFVKGDNADGLPTFFGLP